MNRVHTHLYQLKAGECNAESQMPLTLLAEQVIEVATEHANKLGIGYEAVTALGFCWVLSRLSVAVHRMPQINDHYRATTWISDYNRRFSERDIEFTDPDGHDSIASVKTRWAVIDFGTRAGADLSALERSDFPVTDRSCHVERLRRIPMPDPATAVQRKYHFAYSDIDSNRHVRTVRYLGLLLDSHDMHWHDTHRPMHLDLAFHAECRYGSSATIVCAEADPALIAGADAVTVYSITPAGADRPAVTAAIGWKSECLAESEDNA